MSHNLAQRCGARAYACRACASRVERFSTLRRAATQRPSPSVARSGDAARNECVRHIIAERVCEKCGLTDFSTHRDRGIPACGKASGQRVFVAHSRSNVRCRRSSRGEIPAATLAERWTHRGFNRGNAPFRKPIGTTEPVAAGSPPVSGLKDGSSSPLPLLTRLKEATGRNTNRSAISGRNRFACPGPPRPLLSCDGEPTGARLESPGR